MGLPAERDSQQTTPRLNDIVIRGYLLSVEEGSAAKRVALGFGSGASELQTVVEGYQMANRGLRKLGFDTVDAGASKTPGAAVPLAVAIARGLDQLSELAQAEHASPMINHHISSIDLRR
jgi:hypothetical protein